MKNNRYIFKSKTDEKATHVETISRILLSSKVSKLLYDSEFDFALEPDKNIINLCKSIPYKVTNRIKGKN